MCSETGSCYTFIRRPGSACTVFFSYVESKFCPKIQNPKSEIQNPKSESQNPKFAHKDLLHNAPKSKIQHPKSNIQNQKIQNPNSKLARENPKFGALGASHKDLLHNDPKSKIPKIRPKSLDFGYWIGEFWVFDSGRDLPLGNCASRSKARIPPGPPLTASAKPTVSHRVGQKGQTWLEKHGEKEVKTICFTISWLYACTFGLFVSGGLEGTEKMYSTCSCFAGSG